MAGSRAALRVGLIGGLVLSIAVAAQQITDAPDLQCFGYLITLFGLGIIGYLAARDVGDFERLPSLRAGAVGGLIAGLLASLAVVAVLLVLSVSGDNLQRINAAIREMYTPSQLGQYASMGITVDSIAQMTSLIQILCCPAGLPIMGLALGTIGGALASTANRNRGADPDKSS
jgi:hypothetical protein